MRAETHRSNATTRRLFPTLADKLWGRHVVRSAKGEPDLLYVDLHLVHEVTSCP